MPRHNALHVNMLLMPQRHDLLVQLLYPTYKRTHKDTRKLLIIIVTPNRKTIPLPLKGFLCPFLTRNPKMLLNIQPHFIPCMKLYWNILY